MNLNKFIRYKTIDRELVKNTALGNKTDELLNVAILIKAINLEYREQNILQSVNGNDLRTVDRQQIYDDINFLKSDAGPEAPILIKKVNGKSNYVYKRKDFSIFKTNWYKQTALRHIEKDLRILEPELMDEGRIFIELRENILNQLSDYDDSRKIIYKSNDPNAEWHYEFMTFYKAILNKQVLHLKYKSFNEDDGLFEFEFHPHILKEYNRRYYVYGYNPDERIEWTIPLDRVLNVSTIKDEDYIEEVYLSRHPDGTAKPEIWSEADWGDYFSEMVGIARFADTELKKITLRFQYPDYKYFESKPIIPEDKIEDTASENGEYKDFTFHLYPNRELEDVIIGYIPKVEIIEPLELREKIAKRLKAALKMNK